MAKVIEKSRRSSIENLIKNMLTNNEEIRTISWAVITPTTVKIAFRENRV